MSKTKKQYIDLEEHRYGLFMNDKSFDLNIMYGREWLRNDNVQEVLIFKLNLIETKSHSLYGQAKASDKKFFAPVKINGLVNVESNDQKNYGDEKGGIARNDTGKLTLSVFLKELEEKNLEINRGDIIQYNISGEKNRYYEVENAMNVTDSSENTIAGYKTYYRKITAVPAKQDTIPLLNEII